MSERLPDVSVIAPTLNEAGNVDDLLARLLASTSAAGLSAEMIVVDDASTDGTPDRVREWLDRGDVRLLDGPRRGLSAAVLAGAAAARAEVVVVIDADGSHPAERVPDLARLVAGGGCDVAIGSRYVPGGSTVGWPWWRYLTSHVASAPARILTPVRDPMSGFFAVRREMLLEAAPAARGFKILLELLAHGGEALRVTELPIAFRERTSGTSKLSRGVAVEYGSQLLALCGATPHGGDVLRACAFAAVLAAATIAAAGPLGPGRATAHGVAFAVAAAVYLALPARDGGVRPVRDLRSLGRFLAAAAFALAASSAALLLAAKTGAPDALAACASAVVGAACLAAGVAFHVRPARAATPAVELSVLCVAIAAASLVLRLLYAPLVPLLPEEAYYWAYSEHPALSYLDHPPMVAWLIRAGTAVLGRSELGVRAASAACWVVTVLCMVRLTWRLAGRTASFVAAALLSALPFFVGAAFTAMPDAPLTACWAAALLFLERALLAGNARSWWGVGIALGLGMLSKYPIALVGLAAVVFMASDLQSRRWFRRPAPYAAALLAAALFTPVIWWNATNGWASFIFQSAGRAEHHRFDLPAFVGATLFAATPFGLLAAWAGLRRAAPAAGALDERARRFCLMFTAVPLAVFAFASLRAQTRINWPGPPLLAAVPAMSAAVVAAYCSATDRLGRRVAAWFAPTAVVVVAAFGLVAQCVTAGLPFAGHVTAWCTAWEPLAAEVAAIDAAVARDEGGVRPVVAGMDKYGLAAVLTFYDPDPSRPFCITSVNVVGGAGVMYETWSPAAAFAGRSVVLVSRDKADLTERATVARFARVDDVRTLDVQRDGRPVGEWYARVGHGYRPPRRHPGRAGPPAELTPR